MPKLDLTRPEDQFEFSTEALESLVKIGLLDFSKPLSAYPRESRIAVLANRYIFQKYLENEDLIRAARHHKFIREVKPEGFSIAPGLSFLRLTLQKRSKGAWITERETFIENSGGWLEQLETEWAATESSIQLQPCPDGALKPRAILRLVVRPGAP